MKPIVWSKPALKALRRMPRNLATGVIEKVETYAADPQALANNVISLEGHPDLLRMRVGDWRVVFTEDETQIVVTVVAPRGSAYGGGD